MRTVLLLAISSFLTFFEPAMAEETVTTTEPPPTAQVRLWGQLAVIDPETADALGLRRIDSEASSSDVAFAVITDEEKARGLMDGLRTAEQDGSLVMVSELSGLFPTGHPATLSFLGGEQAIVVPGDLGGQDSDSATRREGVSEPSPVELAVEVIPVVDDKERLTLTMEILSNGPAKADDESKRSSMMKLDTTLRIQDGTPIVIRNLLGGWQLDDVDTLPPWLQPLASALIALPGSETYLIIIPQIARPTAMAPQ